MVNEVVNRKMRERVKELRKALKLTQADFASTIGITRTGYASIETGGASVQERHIKLILAAFPTVSETWLRTGEGSMFVESDDQIDQLVKQYDFPDITRKMLEVYQKMEPEKQKVVLEYAQRLVSGMLQGRTIEEEVEAYRQELISAQVTPESSASGTGSENIQNKKIPR